MAEVSKLEKAHHAATGRHQEAVAEAERADLELERLTAEIADSPIQKWVARAGTYMEALGLQRLAAAAARVLARRRHAALVAVYQARVDELAAPAQETFEAAREARGKADDFDKRLRRLINGGDPEAKALKGAERDEYEIKLRTDREEARARATVLQRARNAASARKHQAEQELAEVKADAPD